MNRVNELDEKYPMKKSLWNDYLTNLRLEIEIVNGLKLHARDVQNCLCEFSKYERGLWQTGHMKRRYAGA